MMQLTIFDIFAVIWQTSVLDRPKMVRLKPFLTPHLETPKRHSHRKEKLCPGHSSTVMQNFTPIGGTVAEISVPRQKQNYLKFNIVTTLYQRTADNNLNTNSNLLTETKIVHSLPLLTVIYA